MEKQQNSLFDTTLNEDPVSGKGKALPPLAHKNRPQSMDEFVGHERIFSDYPFLKRSDFPSLVLFGPSGTGKTTLARLLAMQSNKEFYRFNAVLGGVADLKKLIHSAEEMKKYHGKEAIIFIDEIHRFNKSQQDALLPYIEEGAFTLIGATTENPRVSINKALLSRLHVVELKELSTENIAVILKQAAQKFSLTVERDHLMTIASYAGGDARVALNTLEEAAKLHEPTKEDVKKLIIENARAYDKGGNRHYDVISAFIKSLRGSDPQSAILWLAVMIDGGEDPVFIARRLVIFASEDVGNADPTALSLATSALSAISQIGMPEARIILAQATTYLASTYKSNAAYLAIDEALAHVRDTATIDVPDHLKNYPPPGTKPYLYPHNFEGHFVNQKYTTKPIPNFYRPTAQGKEEALSKRLEALWKFRDANKALKK
jgi:putative ATPase